jgi:hypothetical protein
MSFPLNDLLYKEFFHNAVFYGFTKELEKRLELEAACLAFGHTVVDRLNVCLARLTTYTVLTVVTTL